MTMNREPGAAPALHRAMYRIPEAMHILSLSRSVIYEEIRAKRLAVVHRGKSARITAHAIAAYVALLEQEAA